MSPPMSPPMNSPMMPPATPVIHRFLIDDELYASVRVVGYPVQLLEIAGRDPRRYHLLQSWGDDELVFPGDGMDILILSGFPIFRTAKGKVTVTSQRPKEIPW